MGFCCERSQSLQGRLSTLHPSPQPPVLEALEATVSMGNRELALQQPSPQSLRSSLSPTPFPGSLSALVEAFY